MQQWPAPFSVWSEDSSQEGGYKLLKSSITDPTREEIDELFDVSACLSIFLVLLYYVIVVVLNPLLLYVFLGKFSIYTLLLLLYSLACKVSILNLFKLVVDLF